MGLFDQLVASFAEGELRGLAKKALDPYVAKGDINAEQEAVMEQAALDFAQLALAEFEKRQGAAS